jgi:hypothetical protein
MSIDQRMIEQIVANVMNRLMTPRHDVRAANNGRSGPNSNKHQAAPDRSAAERQGQSTGPSVPLFDDNVLTEAYLQERLNGQPRIAVGPKTIVTPAARDLLKARGIVWQRQCTGGGAAKAVGRWKIVNIQSTPAVEAVLDNVQQLTGVDWQQETVGSADEAVVWAVNCLCRAEADGVVVLAALADRIACRANRNPAVRAAVARDVQTVTVLKRELGANLLCIAPENKSLFELRNLLRAYTAGGPPQIPNDWND